MTNEPTKLNFPTGGLVPEFDLADRMRKSLRTSGMGVAEIAMHLEVTRETVGTWINGRNKPSALTLRAWSSLTNVDLDWLKTGQAPTSLLTSGPDDRLPRLDSNQQPSGYRYAQVSDLVAYRARRAS